MFSICNNTSSVLSSEVPGGSDTSDKIAPVSSPGTNALGVIFNSKTNIPAKTAKPKKATHLRLIKNSTPLLYFTVVASKATHNAMNDISSAIISITLVMSAVFIPVSFISGSAGVFYQQFGLTLAVAIVLSAVNALTLSPALCAIFLKTSMALNQE